MDHKTTFISTLVVDGIGVSREGDEVTATLCGMDLEQQKQLRIDSFIFVARRIPTGKRTEKLDLSLSIREFICDRRL